MIGARTPPAGPRPYTRRSLRGPGRSSRARGHRSKRPARRSGRWSRRAARSPRRSASLPNRTQPERSPPLATLQCVHERHRFGTREWYPRPFARVSRCSEKQKTPRLAGLSQKRMMGLEPTTFCMASVPVGAREGPQTRIDTGVSASRRSGTERANSRCLRRILGGLGAYAHSGCFGLDVIVGRRGCDERARAAQRTAEVSGEEGTLRWMSNLCAPRIMSAVRTHGICAIRLRMSVCRWLASRNVDPVRTGGHDGPRV